MHNYRRYEKITVCLLLEEFETCCFGHPTSYVVVSCSIAHEDFVRLTCCLAIICSGRQSLAHEDFEWLAAWPSYYVVEDIFSWWGLGDLLTTCPVLKAKHVNTCTIHSHAVHKSVETISCWNVNEDSDLLLGHQHRKTVSLLLKGLHSSDLLLGHNTVSGRRLTWMWMKTWSCSQLVLCWKQSM